jgi:hypothetical protein
MVSIRKAPGFQRARIQKILVVGVFNTAPNRQAFENAIAGRLKARKIAAAASWQALPPGVAVDKAGIASFAKAQGYDTVLVTRLTDVHMLQPVDKPIRAQKPSEIPYDDTRLSDELPAIVASPEYGLDYQVAVVISNLYDVATEKPVWTGTSRTLVTGDAAQFSRPYAKILVNKLFE